MEDGEENKRDSSKRIVKGRVSSTEGTWLSGAIITCGKATTTALTDGSYTLSGLTPGAYELEARLQGYSGIRMSISIAQDEDLELNLVLTKKKGTSLIRGRVIDAETSQPLHDGKVILVMPISNRYSPINDDGRYLFSEVAEGNYSLHISIPGYVDDGVKITVPEGEPVVQDFICKSMNLEEPPWG
jgi:hypothetical protein